MTAPSLSVVIPALDEARVVGGLLGDLAALRAPHEVIVVDGGSTDETAAVAAAHGALVVPSARGRGTQLRAGAAVARAPMLCFLHADVRLPPAALAALESFAANPATEPGAWAFRLRIDGRRWSYRLIEWGANVRSSLLALPYGDQGLITTRDCYEGVGGYADVPLMEDVLIARALQRVGGIALLPEALLASPRRWERDGALRRSLTNLWLLVRFMMGAPPEALLERYAHASRRRYRCRA